MRLLTVTRKENDLQFLLSDHLLQRMQQRAIRENAIVAALSLGRIIRSRGACFYVIGKRDLNSFRQCGVNLERLENMQVVVDAKTNTVVTVYKNNNFRKIRPFKHRERWIH